MKKAYSKPDILFESFMLSTNIAAGCEEKPYNSTDNCGVLWSRNTIFLQDMTGCASKIQDEDAEHNMLCYHVPYEGYNVFYS